VHDRRSLCGRLNRRMICRISNRRATALPVEWRGFARLLPRH